MCFIELKIRDNPYVRSFPATGAHTVDGLPGTFPALTYPPLIDKLMIKQKYLPRVGYAAHLAGIFGKYRAVGTLFLSVYLFMLNAGSFIPLLMPS